MTRPHTRDLVFKNTVDFDETAASEFITHFYPLAFHICKECVQRRGIYCGMDVCESSAREACFKVFMIEQESPSLDYSHQKGRVRICCKQCLWSMLTTYGYIRSSGQKFFPTEWMPIDFLQNQATTPNVYEEIDQRQLVELLKIVGDEYENDIIELFLIGYDFVEIGQRLKKGKSAISKKFQSIIKRFDEHISNMFYTCNECGATLPKRNQREKYCSNTCMRKAVARRYYESIRIGVGGNPNVV